ncbi:hypothetical protein CONPUDRAFT_71383 [Coniophora puteana RWD-64-598 SS2]|uniref:Chitin synthase export chaperone n=1 Tax=Coniophora puteana (strain RWD-64-598) TaxID=741705 RepID=A0A5M3MTY5_CONPW|nr:uncharacterized protein CONPUDRAFT_71383 [Coniophora puteana RWD-64-598 SS2]EIW82623.1 hypothetical protein CONPUDRAFT_71383 [Coniophora puteana RWD-64-598 SS2]
MAAITSSWTFNETQYDLEVEDSLDARATILTRINFSEYFTEVSKIELVWMHPKNTMSCLFIVNRYLTPLGFIECDHYARYEGVMLALAVEIAELMMLVRVAALYNNHKVAVSALGLIHVAWLAVAIWLMIHGAPVMHTPAVHSSSTLASSFAWIPMTYDTIVITLILWRTIPDLYAKEINTIGSICYRLMVDGLIYYMYVTFTPRSL